MTSSFSPSCSVSSSVRTRRLALFKMSPFARHVDHYRSRNRKKRFPAMYRLTGGERHWVMESSLTIGPDSARPPILGRSPAKRSSLASSLEQSVAEAADVVLRDGGTLRLRAPLAADGRALLAFFEGLSDQSRYLRFHGFRRGRARAGGAAARSGLVGARRARRLAG
jgi:hypothetical protein